ncbi:phage capsid protein [Marinilactibacillus sp. Marseille-P9653]|uniref:phage capsid protein n=1 Tax=Marinilactibacillus sp. Marseille-P9653 TaxID=2866583 RepID=UPI001CE476C7|nr:phage capsid protein [Marinilactibacillus sp. Marseille-P9653]
MNKNKLMKMQLQFFAERSENYPEPNTQKQANFNNLDAKSIDYSYRFGENFKKFIEALGITRHIEVQEGFTLKLYKAPVVELADGKVGEGELIPLSKVIPQVADTKEITLDKYRKVTTVEAIQRFGRDEAINKTDGAMIREIQKGIRDYLFDTIKTHGTDQVNLNAGTLQGALASAWGALEVLFEDDVITTVAFVNPMDVAKEIANKEITLETQFGLRYYTDVTGTVVMLNNTIPQGTVYATASENLQVAHISADSDAFKEFNMYTDEFGYIGIAHGPTLEILSVQTVALSGILIFPERLDGMVKIDIAGPEDENATAGTNSVQTMNVQNMNVIQENAEGNQDDGEQQTDGPTA